jgi:hypothetical protein
MNNIQTRTITILAALAALMAATRFNHFGTAVSLPDASLAVFFLGGMYLSRFARLSLIAFTALIIEAGLIDYYATSVQGVSAWCMTPAYWFLIPTYGSLWFIGSWFASRHVQWQGKERLMLIPVAWAANSFAFVFSNAAFYLLSGHFAKMGAAEYVGSVTQYYVSYVSVALLYIACAVAIDMLFGMQDKQAMHSTSDAA